MFVTMKWHPLLYIFQIVAKLTQPKNWTVYVSKCTNLSANLTTWKNNTLLPKAKKKRIRKQRKITPKCIVVTAY